MVDFLDPEALRYFFGAHFNVDTALAILPNYKDANSLRRELQESIDEQRAHLGIQFIGYQDIDTGFSTVALMKHPGHPSGVSFFADSKHRVFGGSTLICVPLAFCSTLYKPEGNHIVYRHTFKKPRFTPDDIDRLSNSGPPDQRFKSFLYTKWREGYETIKGMSYVGITSRTWQERYLEHVPKALEKASSTRFHEAMRAMEGQKVICVHDVSAYGVTRDDATAYESKLIKESTLYPLGLNMKG